MDTSRPGGARYSVMFWVRLDVDCDSLVNRLLFCRGCSYGTESYQSPRLPLIYAKTTVTGADAGTFLVACHATSRTTEFCIDWAIPLPPPGSEQWTHYAFVADGTAMRLFVNGTLDPVATGQAAPRAVVNRNNWPQDYTVTPATDSGGAGGISNGGAELLWAPTDNPDPSFPVSVFNQNMFGFTQQPWCGGRLGLTTSSALWANLPLRGPDIRSVMAEYPPAPAPNG